MIRNLAVAALILAASVQAQPAVDTILHRLEKQYSMVNDMRARVSLTEQKANQGVKKFDVQYYRRDSDKSFLIIMQAPEAEKGNGYLRTGDNFWMYRKNTRTFQHINRDESIGGSDAHGDDFETRNLTELYAAATDKDGKEVIAEEKLGQIPVWRFDVKAKVNDVDYPRKTYWIQKDKYLLLKEQAYTSSNTLMQTAYYLKYTTISGRYVPIQQIFVDEFEKGNKTIVELSDIVLGKLDDAIFTKAYLENLSK